MKTIALSEAAYERLAAWKTKPGETFSTLIEKLIPAKGTIDAALAGARELPELPAGAWESFEADVSATRRRIK